MTDFHSHILPGMDDGASNVEESVEMLRMSALQGVNKVFLTPHFYADEESPSDFLRRREASFAELRSALSDADFAVPELCLGAEVYYFPGLSECEEIRALEMEGTGLLLVEPPMIPWTQAMLGDIRACRETLGLVPVVAHVDRYCRMLRDRGLFDRLSDENIPAQVNASFFLRHASRRWAMRLLHDGAIHFLGSDCHNTEQRPPNLGAASFVIAEAGQQSALRRLMRQK